MMPILPVVADVLGTMTLSAQRLKNLYADHEGYFSHISTKQREKHPRRATTEMAWEVR
jgi:hypothetical protein